MNCSSNPQNARSIVHVIYSGLGGHSFVLFTLLRAGLYRDFRHHIIFAGVESPSSDMYKSCIELGCTYTYIRRKPTLFTYPEYLLSVFANIISIKPSLVFLNGLSCVPLLIILRCPVIVRDTQNPSLKTKIEWLLLFYANLFSDRVVYLTDESKSSAKSKFNFCFKAAKSHIIPNPVDTDYFASKSILPAIDVGTVNLGMVSRLQPIKDHETILHALALLKEINPSRKYVFHVAGSGPTYNPLKLLSSKLNLDNVIFYGQLSNHMIRNLLRSLHIYIHMTSGETMSNSILQAMSCSLPIIASDVEGVSNLISSNHGLLTPHKSPRHLAFNIKAMVDNYSFSTLLGRNARQHVINTCSVQAVVACYECLFDSCLKDLYKSSYENSGMHSPPKGQ